MNLPTSNDASFFLRQNRNEYIFVSSCVSRLDIKTDKITIIEGKCFKDNEIRYFTKLGNNVNVYTFHYYSTIENNGEINDIPFSLSGGTVFLDQAYSGNSLLIGNYYYDYSEKDVSLHNNGFQLNLIKEPYNKINKRLFIQDFSAKYTLKIIGLKDIFVIIMMVQNDSYFYSYISSNITYKIYDLNLNPIGTSLTIEYKNYTDIQFSELSENNKINEFLMCIKYSASITDCQIIKYENSSLIFLETYSIFSFHNVGYTLYFYLYITLFDEDKIGLYIKTSYYNYITILQYENKKLFYYKNIKDIQIQELDGSGKKIMIMTDQGIGIYTPNSLGDKLLYYISSICLTKNISLYGNILSEFPIKKIIFPGIDELNFSFDYIDKDLTIYKNSTR